MKFNGLMMGRVSAGAMVAVVFPLIAVAQKTPDVNKIPEGVYQGVLTASTSSAFRLLVLPNGQTWGLYGRPMSAGLEVAGFVQGQGEFSDGRFTVKNGIDFGAVPPAAFVVQGTYKAGTSVQGLADSGGYQVKFTGEAMPKSVYDYASAAKLSSVQGRWKMMSLSSSPIDMTIGADGRFTVKPSDGACAFSGQIKPHASGKNVFDFQVQFGPAPCLAAGQNARGLAMVEGKKGVEQRLVMLGFTDDRKIGAAVQGLR